MNNKNKNIYLPNKTVGAILKGGSNIFYKLGYGQLRNNIVKFLDKKSKNEFNAVDNFTNFLKLKNLKRVTVDGELYNQIHQYQNNMINELIKFKNLQELKLINVEITNMTLQNIQMLENLILLDLSTLNLQNNNLKFLRCPPLLQTLNLKNCLIGHENIKNLSLPPGLQTLNLKGNDIGDAIQHLKLPQGLHYLNLEHNNIGPEGVKNLTLPESLKIFKIAKNHIRMDGLNGWNLPEGLEVLDIRNNLIFGVMLKPFPKHLQSISLMQNLGFMELMNKVPKGCKIY